MLKKREPELQPEGEAEDEQPTDHTQKTFPDTLSQKGAIALAKRLQDYWHAQGFPAVRFWTEPVEERFSKVGTYELYRVACNLVNGKPPQYRDDK